MPTIGSPPSPLALAKGLRRGFDRGSYRRGLAVGVATLLQILGQRRVSPVTAAVVFPMEPVFALAFSLALGLEELS
ncbi:MAG: hypothetical protein LM571_03210 [Desulfurococcaceae archaeon]|nr:hypothetical protein [Desulfurococcaceae archaeon]